MIKLETNRLEIISGTLEHIRAEINNRTLFAEILNAEVPDNWPPPLNDEESQNYFLKYAEAHPDPDGYSFWYIIFRDETKRKLIGGIGFKGEPLDDGTIEIGYSIMESHQRNGYATEAVAALVKWAFGRNKVARVIAETLDDGILSQKVLLKNGFETIGVNSGAGITRYELKKEVYTKVPR